MITSSFSEPKSKDHACFLYSPINKNSTSKKGKKAAEKTIVGDIATEEVDTSPRSL